MRTFTILFTLFYFMNALAAAPYGIQGQNQSTTLYSNVHKFPNSQVTNLGGINALVETGNKNILVNPSFEHATFSTNWTSTGTGSFFEDVGSPIDGKKAAGFLMVSQTINLTQDSTAYAGQFADGVQGLVSVRVKANNGATGIKVCSRQAGVTSTTNCVDVVANGKWGLYKVPVILGSSSNGISIASTGNVTSVVYIDDAFVGAVDLKADIDSSKIVGSSYFTGSANPTVSTEAVFSNAGVNAPTINFSNMGLWDTTDSNAIQQTVNNLPAGCYRAEFTHLVGHLNTAGVLYNTCITENGTESACTNASRSYSTQPSNGSSNTKTTRDICFSQSGNRTFALRGAASSGSIFVNFSGTVGFSLYYFSSGSVYSSTNADTDWASCGLTGAAFTGFGSSVPAPSLQCKRQGSDLLIQGRFTAGTTPTAVEARISLPTWNGVQLVSAGSSIIPTSQIAGNIIVNGQSTTFFGDYALIEPSVTYFTIGQQASTTSALTKALGNAIAASGSIFTISARIPIEGWQQSNIIIGQFNGLESCSSTLDCTDTFSASVTSTGTVVAGSENVDWINGNCTFGTGYLCGFNTGIFTVAPNCTVTPSDTTGGLSLLSSTTSSSVTPIFISRTDAGSTNVATNFRIVCQKAGVDYIGKTAQAVANDQSLRVPGATNYVTYMASLECDNASQILHQDGNWISSIGNIATGQCSVVMNASKFANANYRCSWGTTVSQSNGATGQISTVRMLNASKTTSGFNLVGYYNSGGTTVANTDFTIDLICTGQAP